jgi:hypothetical protein
MKKDLLLPMLKLKYQTLHLPHCSQIKNKKKKMKDGKFVYIRRAKMKLDGYKTHLEGIKECDNSWHMIEKIIIRCTYSLL